MAAKITDEQALEDTICPNKMQNIIVISTPHQITRRLESAPDPDRERDQQQRPQQRQPNNGSWASRVGGASRSTSSKPTGKAQAEHAPDYRIRALEHGNRALRKDLEELRASIARIESGHGISQPSSPTPPTPRIQQTIHNTHTNAKP
ncbi:hypothetical protein MTO96_046490 [Rhipicephalus appendiculatus]